MNKKINIYDTSHVEMVERIRVHDDDYLWLVKEANEKVKLNNTLSKRLNYLIQLTPKSSIRRKELVALYNTTIQVRHDMIYYYEATIDDEERTISTLIEDVPENYGIDDLRFLIDKYQKGLLIELELK